METSSCSRGAVKADQMQHLSPSLSLSLSLFHSNEAHWVTYECYNGRQGTDRNRLLARAGSGPPPAARRACPTYGPHVAVLLPSIHQARRLELPKHVRRSLIKKKWGGEGGGVKEVGGICHGSAEAFFGRLGLAFRY